MTPALVATAISEVPPQAANSYRLSLFNALNFQIFWVLVTGGLVPLHYLFVGFNYLVLGIAGGLFSIANTNLRRFVSDAG